MPPDDEPELFPTPPPGPPDSRAPLADRMRPRRLEDVVGQEHLLRPGAALRSLAEAEQLPSLILWGPPGCGKTTLARLLANGPKTRFEPLSAVTVGVKEIRAVVERARREARAGWRTVLFLDELHRLNRAQQDALLPHVEAGTVTLLGATTENPSFEVIGPLLSRCRAFTLERLGPEALEEIVRRAAGDEERGLGRVELALSDEAVSAIAQAADGDARRALGLLETAAAIHRARGADAPLPAETVREAADRRLLLYDRDREEHYNVVSGGGWLPGGDEELRRHVEQVQQQRQREQQPRDAGGRNDDASRAHPVVPGAVAATGGPAAPPFDNRPDGWAGTPKVGARARISANAGSDNRGSGSPRVVYCASTLSALRGIKHVCKHSTLCHRRARRGHSPLPRRLRTAGAELAGIQQLLRHPRR